MWVDCGADFSLNMGVYEMRNSFGVSKQVLVSTSEVIKQAGANFAEVSTDNREIIEQFNLFFVTLFVFAIYVL